MDRNVPTKNQNSTNVKDLVEMSKRWLAYQTIHATKMSLHATKMSLGNCLRTFLLGFKNQLICYNCRSLEGKKTN